MSLIHQRPKGIQVDAIVSNTPGQPIKLGVVEAVRSAEILYTLSTTATGPYAAAADVDITVSRSGRLCTMAVPAFSPAATIGAQISIDISGLPTEYTPTISTLSVVQIIDNVTGLMGVALLTPTTIRISNGVTGTVFSGAGTAGPTEDFTISYIV